MEMPTTGNENVKRGESGSLNFQRGPDPYAARTRGWPPLGFRPIDAGASEGLGTRTVTPDSTLHMFNGGLNVLRGFL